MKVIDSGTNSAQENMGHDFWLLKNIGKENSLLIRFYEWSSLSVTHGYFMDPLAYLDAAAIKKHQLQIAKRPTGGGLLFHSLDFTFSLIIPAKHPKFIENVLESYRAINDCVVRAVEQTFNIKASLAIDGEPSPRGGFCMAKPTIYDVMLKEKKIGGSAQRRTREGLLHQGSITLCMLDEGLLHEFLPEHPTIAQDIHTNSIALVENEHELERARKSLKENILKEIIN